jgi:hypothetical protein
MIPRSAPSRNSPDGDVRHTGAPLRFCRGYHAGRTMINLGGLDKGPELGEGCVEADESWRAREALRQAKRAGIALLVVGGFWLWLLLGSAGFIAAIFESPKAIVVAFYGGAVLVLVSLLVALTATMVLLANWPDKSQRQAAYSSTQERTSKALALVLRHVRNNAGMLRSGGTRPAGPSFHAIRAYLSGQLPGLRARLLAAIGRLTGWTAGPATGSVRQAARTGRSFVARKTGRKIPGLQPKGAPVAGVGPLPRAEAARSQPPVARQAGPVSARTSFPVRRPPMPNRLPASAAAPRPPRDRRDVTS